MKNIVIVGSSGAIGNALTKQLVQRHPEATLHAFSSKGLSPFEDTHVLPGTIDYDDENSIQRAAEQSSREAPLDLVIVSTGLLHSEDLNPEKSLGELSAENFHSLFDANTIFPSLVAKHFLPHLNQERHSCFAVLSARVGSISDNFLGGWYAYRASKAALNMVIKCAAIETARRNKGAIVVGLHPGTVDSPLSKPFQRNVPEGQLFSPDFAAEKLLSVVDQLTPECSGKCFAWDGTEIEP